VTLTGSFKFHHLAASLDIKSIDRFFNSVSNFVIETAVLQTWTVISCKLLHKVHRKQISL